MSDLGRRIRHEVRAAVEKAGRDAAANLGVATTTVAGVTNIGGGSQSNSVYSDAYVTVITRNGQTEVIPHQVAEHHGPPVAEQG